MPALVSERQHGRANESFAPAPGAAGLLADQGLQGFVDRNSDAAGELPAADERLTGDPEFHRSMVNRQVLVVSPSAKRLAEPERASALALGLGH